MKIALWPSSSPIFTFSISTSLLKFGCEVHLVLLWQLDCQGHAVASESSCVIHSCCYHSFNVYKRDALSGACLLGSWDCAFLQLTLQIYPHNSISTALHAVLPTGGIHQAFSASWLISAGSGKSTSAFVDAFINECEPELGLHVVALAFQEQLVEEIPITENDQPMDILITPERVRAVSERGHAALQWVVWTCFGRTACFWHIHPQYI